MPGGTDPTPPLHGVRIADFSRLLPGAYCTWLLTSLGAEVIKVEQPGRGDYQRDLGLQAGPRGGAVFQHVNGGKRSLGLDLKNPAAAPVLQRLVATSDILVESFRPGVAARLGLDFDKLLSDRPELVCISISGFGANSPLRDTAAHDINYLAYSGAIARPLHHGDGLPETPLVDLIGGGLVPALSAVSLLLRARTIGRGGLSDTAMADALPMLPNEILSAAILGLAEPDREKAPFSGGAANYTTYELRDGHVAVGAVEPQFWTKFCRIMKLDPSASTDAVMRAEIAEKFRNMTRAEVETLFRSSDTCVTAVNNYGDMLVSDHAKARDYLATSTEGENMPPIGSPFHHDGRRQFAMGPAPALGQQSTEILIELGFNDTEISILENSGAISTGVTADGQTGSAADA
ncbi:CaiB/BaiF CoA-transferase family protein [Pseudoruegeria sp. HB172150]|uniref:CaiB/BaiF CoA transferase family protein n=1 Tax=Pseudoruegeria sp. HB172150 TaxID=2721164 RepID=UPI001555F89D|nr:CaiB/BaiF CoA-transferase family protein [Pseudoruegeria sp. HB172150]